MNEQILKEGDVVKFGKHELECVVVNWRERDGKRENFVYSFRPKTDMETERKETSNPEPTNEEEQ